jgi:hypothetical protein
VPSFERHKREGKFQEVSKGSFIKRPFGNQYGQKAIHKSKIVHVGIPLD